MSLREILHWPDPRLAQPAAPVTDPAEMAELIGDMFETMYDAPGRGLAAPQVGVSARVFVMDTGWKDGEMTPIACINPQILWRSDTVATGGEGCLSVPGVTAEVPRATEIVLGYTDINGAAQERHLTGADAIFAQHEYDHLDGVMHFDRLSAPARDALLAEYESRA
ncbi:peptide deformylase [Pseudoponticoccus marisrubri]|uniref:Peptide deformylase n=1 Tax=Pseudoponticoccus marisrubri TaxID=1685382 RepID=A0A0W7WKI0_9RHOB|nr:peptide deformylase [Pseudoponticoccus marisrubri]KUF11041.1 N-formylmethionyl-tRNA deformylase [Pseudoponticoccus marisrubri]